MEQAESPMNQISELNKKMMKYENECGCTLGAQFMTAAFAVSMLITIYRYHFISMKFLSHLPVIVLITIGAAGIGKLSGILYAKYKYKEVSKQLTNYLTNLKKEELNYAGIMEKNSG
jgi:hypothetical protein